MNSISRILTLTLITSAAALAGCASSPPAPATGAPATAAAPAAAKKAPLGQTQHKWSMATEEEVAAELDKKFMDAAKQFTKLKKDDQIMYCKRFRDIGSMIPTLHCITEAQLRKQVEDSDEARERMRQTMGKCNMAPGVGCSAGQ